MYQTVVPDHLYIDLNAFYLEAGPLYLKILAQQIKYRSDYDIGC